MEVVIVVITLMPHPNYSQIGYILRLPELEEQKTTNDNKREACQKEHHKEPTNNCDKINLKVKD